MKLRDRSTLSEIMGLLKKADVRGATAAIQQALGFKTAKSTPPPEKDVDRRSSKRQAPVNVRPASNLARKKASTAPSPMAPATAKAPTNDAKASFVRRSYRSAAGSLNYKLYIPTNHAARDLALIVMLHGCTQDPDDFARGTQMNTLADEFGLIVAYPHQPKSANAQGCWNWFDRRHQKRGSGEPALIAGLAEDLVSEFAVDPKNVFAAGLSAGGAMADVLATTYPDIFAAIGVHSGLPYGAAHNVMTAFSAMKGLRSTARQSDNQQDSVVRKIIFHGSADSTVSASNGAEILNQVQEQHYGLAELVSESSVGGRSVTRSILNDVKGNTIAEHWLVNNAGHAWFGAKHGGSFVEPTGPDASREMIRFFLS